MKIMSTIGFWLHSARVHTLPMSIMGWLIVFCFALKQGGNLLYGILALVGIAFAHLGSNLMDDYFDYKREASTTKASAKNGTISMPQGKCEYLINNKATLNQLLFVTFIFFGLASLVGLFFLSIFGWPILMLVAFAVILCLFYSFLTYWGLGEFAVGMTFGPLLFVGVYFVMMGYFSLSIVLLSISFTLLIIGVLHIHALMDYDLDLKDNKKSLCIIAGSKQNALLVLGVMMALAYINIAVGIFLKIFPLVYVGTFLTLPLAISLYNLMKQSINTPNVTSERKIWMGPMENWEEINKNNIQNFMLRFYISRNMVTFFTVLLCIGILVN